jgi:hypothetical protein
LHSPNFNLYLLSRDRSAIEDRSAIRDCSAIQHRCAGFSDRTGRDYCRALPFVDPDPRSGK